MGNSIIGASWTIVSRATGFIRVVLIGAVLGPSYFGNLFQLANTLPWILFEFAVGAVLAALVIPPLMSHVAADDRRAVDRLASAMMTAVVGVFAAMVVVAIALTPLLASLLAATVPDGQSDDFRAAAVILFLATTPQLIGYGLAVTGQSIQQAHGSFRLAAAAPVVENLAVIVALVVYAVWLGTGTPLADVDGRHLAVLAVGSSAGVALHALLQLWGVRRVGVRLRFRSPWAEPEVRSVLRLAVPSGGAAVLNGGRLVSLLVAANTIPGGVVAVQLALNVMNLPVALGAKPVTAAMLPEISEQLDAGNRPEVARRLRASLGLAGLVAIPAAVAVAALGWVAGPGLALGELDSSDGRTLLAYAITAVAGGVIGETILQLAFATSYARRDGQTPLAAAGLRFVLMSVAAIVIVTAIDGATVVWWLVIAMSMTDLAAAWVAHRGAIRNLDELDVDDGRPDLRRSLGRSIVASSIGFGLAAGAAVVVQTIGLSSLAAAVVAAGVGIGTTVALRLRLGGPEIDQLRPRGTDEVRIVDPAPVLAARLDDEIGVTS